jgi:hypothetical protein
VTVETPGLPDPTLVVTWPGALVAIVLVFALVMWPGLLAWINSRAARRAAESTEHQVNPNSGKSMRDSTNRVEVMVSTLSTKFDGHVIEERAHRENVLERLTALEQGETVLARLTALEQGRRGRRRLWSRP